MAAQTYGSTTALGTMPRVNLLPPEIAEKATLRKAQVAMLGTGLAAVAVVGVMYVGASAKVSSANEAKVEAAATNVQLQNELGKLQNVRDIYAKVDVANQTLAQAMHYEVRWSTYLHDLTLRMPENVWLTDMQLKMEVGDAGGGNDESVLDPGLGTVTFKGKARAHDDVASWLESLSKQRGYADPYFTKSELKPGGLGVPDIYEFDSTVYLTEKALSGRYKKGLAK